MAIIITMTSKILPWQKTLTLTKLKALGNGSHQLTRTMKRSIDSSVLQKMNYSISGSLKTINKSNSNNNVVNKTNTNKFKYGEDDILDFDTVAKAMIRRNYAIIDLARKGPQENKNVLAFHLKQHAYLDRDMQPRNYAPLKRPIKGALLKNIY